MSSTASPTSRRSSSRISAGLSSRRSRWAISPPPSKQRHRESLIALLSKRQSLEGFQGIQHDRGLHMLHGIMRQEDLVDEMREPVQAAGRDLQMIVHLAGQRVGFQHFGQVVDQE